MSCLYLILLDSADIRNSNDAVLRFCHLGLYNSLCLQHRGIDNSVKKSG